MKRLMFLFVFGAFIIYVQTVAGSNDITLMATDVTSAFDIEQAINQATGQGSHAGTVILDARQGPFTYIDLDRTINISESNLTLRSENGAIIINCHDGILLENSGMHNNIIEGITFYCANSGILGIGVGQYSNHIRNNVINGPGYGIQLNGGFDWVFTGNVIHAGVDAINLVGTTESLISENELSGYEISVFLDQTSGIKVTGNQINSNWQGILLTYGTLANKVNGNTITGPRHSGISLEGGNMENKIHGNVVSCALQFQCTAVSGPPEIYDNNKISGNWVK